MVRAVALSVLLLGAAVLPLAAEVAVPQSAGEVALSFAPVVKQAAPAVVNIYATRVVQAQQSPFADDPFFRQFFEALGPTEPRVQNSLGSGVIVAAEGIVVSNYHVVGQATEIKVVLNDRREYVADVILGDEETDLAILRLRGAEGLPYLPFRNSDEVEVGDLADVTHDPLLAQLRYQLRKHHGAPRPGQRIGVRCVFSREAVAPPDASCAVEGDGSLNCHGYGSLVGVTATFGMCAATEVMNMLVQSSKD